jgi:hypothetical protein
MIEKSPKAKKNRRLIHVCMCACAHTVSHTHTHRVIDTTPDSTKESYTLNTKEALGCPPPMFPPSTTNLASRNHLNSFWVMAAPQDSFYTWTQSLRKKNSSDMVVVGICHLQSQAEFFWEGIRRRTVRSNINDKEDPFLADIGILSVRAVWGTIRWNERVICDQELWPPG